MTNKIELKIIFLENNKIKCCYIDSEKKETTIKLKGRNEEIYPLTISFNNNRISICEEVSNSIQFIQYKHNTNNKRNNTI